ncbi:hypothetical protein [Dyella sp. GSA-30]|uniref:hypothetical protein n=1 Tax=Dyella sp. GSA-30 TaxID=2994496 RepID=UPI00248F72EC|nr:hypothetical protein [Dyella sp. GSA-30]BDU22041.1 hypothetical protein DYGSA30_34980 [Dyella sp. GSA-30]
MSNHKQYRIALTFEERDEIPVDDEIGKVIGWQASFGLSTLLPVIEMIADDIESKDSNASRNPKKVAMALWSVYLQIESLRNTFEDVEMSLGRELHRAQCMIRALQEENRQLRDAPMATDRAA